MTRQESDLLESTERRNNQLYQAIQSLKGELEMEKKTAEVEQQRQFIGRLQEEN